MLMVLLFSSLASNKSGTMYQWRKEIIRWQECYMSYSTLIITNTGNRQLQVIIIEQMKFYNKNKAGIRREPQAWNIPRSRAKSNGSQHQSLNNTSQSSKYNLSCRWWGLLILVLFSGFATRTLGTAEKNFQANSMACAAELLLDLELPTSARQDRYESRVSTIISNIYCSRGICSSNYWFKVFQA